MKKNNWTLGRGKVAVEICGKRRRTIDSLYDIFNLIREKSVDFNLDIKKTAKYRVGE